jgi:hypothetical protein
VCQWGKLDVFASQSSLTDQFCPRSAIRPLISEIPYGGITEDASCFRRSCLLAVLNLESFCFCHSCFSSCSRATEHSRGQCLGYGFRNDVSKLPLSSILHRSIAGHMVVLRLARRGLTLRQLQVSPREVMSRWSLVHKGGSPQC